MPYGQKFRPVREVSINSQDRTQASLQVLCVEDGLDPETHPGGSRGGETYTPADGNRIDDTLRYWR